MIPEIGFSLQAKYDRPIGEVIALLKSAGFSAVSAVWTPELDLPSLAKCAYHQGMNIQSLHAPLKGMPLLWEPGSPESFEVQENMMRSLNACAEFEIPILVVHSWQGLHYTFPETPLDFRFFDELVNKAACNGITIAFENLEGEEYLEALLTRYCDKAHVGFCWDSGHDRCFPHKMDYLERFGNRLFMTHLNDNFGVRDPGGIPSGMDDLHFLPYDGNMDWAAELGRLKDAVPQKILNFEIKIVSKSQDPADLIYANLSFEEFVEKAGQRAQKIAALYAQLMGHT